MAAAKGYSYKPDFDATVVAGGAAKVTFSGNLDVQVFNNKYTTGYVHETKLGLETAAGWGTKVTLVAPTEIKLTSAADMLDFKTDGGFFEKTTFLNLIAGGARKDGVEIQPGLKKWDNGLQTTIKILYGINFAATAVAVAFLYNRTKELGASDYEGEDKKTISNILGSNASHWKNLKATELSYRISETSSLLLAAAVFLYTLMFRYKAAPPKAPTPPTASQSIADAGGFSKGNAHFHMNEYAVAAYHGNSAANASSSILIKDKEVKIQASAGPITSEWNDTATVVHGDSPNPPPSSFVFSDIEAKFKVNDIKFVAANSFKVCHDENQAPDNYPKINLEKAAVSIGVSTDSQLSIDQETHELKSTNINLNGASNLKLGQGNSSLNMTGGNKIDLSSETVIINAQNFKVGSALAITADVLTKMGDLTCIITGGNLATYISNTATQAAANSALEIKAQTKNIQLELDAANERIQELAEVTIQQLNDEIEDLKSLVRSLTLTQNGSPSKEISLI